MFFSKPKVKERIEPRLFPESEKDIYISDQDMEGIVRTAMSYSRHYHNIDDHAEDFILGYGEYENVTFDQKFAWIFTVLGKMIRSEKIKKEVMNIKS